MIGIWGPNALSVRSREGENLRLMKRGADGRYSADISRSTVEWRCRERPYEGFLVED